MASSLNLSLPEPPRSRGRGGIVQWLTLLTAVAAVVLIVLQRPAPAPAETKSGTAEADRLKSLATDLEKRTLYVQAEQVWSEYMAVAALTPEEKAEALYRRGKCLKEGGKHAEAARRLSEVEGYPVSREEKRKARQLLLDCLAALGKQDVRDSVARSFAIGEEEKGTAVARVGSDIITREEVREDLTGAIEQALKMQAAPLTPAEVAQRASELADQEMKDPDALKRAIQQAVSIRVLFREGLERGFADDSAIGDAVTRFRRDFIANRVIDAETENALKNLGPTELQNHYEAHKDRFIEKEGVEFSFGRFPGAAEAEAAIDKLRSAETAAQVKLERPKEVAATGEPVPGIGPAPEITARLLAMKEGEVSSQPLEHGGAFYVLRVEKKRPGRQLEFKEAEPRVRADLAMLKRKEALQNLQSLLTQKFQVELVEEKGAEKSTASPAAKPGDNGPEKPAGKDAPKKEAAPAKP